MTTQKAQSKIKSSTIAITILSVLLAVAVAATVVLAAFSASKQATTTITFGGGLTLTLTAQDSNFTISGGDAGNNLSIQPKGTYSGDATVPAISGQLSEAGFLAYKVNVSVKDGSQGAVTMTYNAGTTSFVSNDLNSTTDGSQTLTVKVNSASAYAAQDTQTYQDAVFAGSASATAAEVISSIQITATDYNDVANYEVTITVDFYAENADGVASATTVANHFKKAA